MTIRFGRTLALLLILFFPFSAMAFDWSGLKAVSASVLSTEFPGETETFCKNFTTFKPGVLSVLDQGEKAVEAALDQANTRLEETRVNRDAQIDSFRSEVDQKRGELLIALQNWVETDEEKQEVEKYQGKIEKAIDDRTDTLSAAGDHFEQLVDTIREKRKAAVIARRDIYHQSIVRALDRVESDCTSGKNVAAIADNFWKNLEEAQRALTEDQSAITNSLSALRSAAAQKRAAFESAEKTFEAKITAARRELLSKIQK